MKEMSKLLMGASLVMVVSLGLVLALLIVLAAELYCSLLFRKRRLHENTTTTTTTTTVTASASVDTASSVQETSSVPFKSVYAQGVLQAPRSLLFPSIILNKEDKPGVLLQDHEITIEEPSSSSRHIREGIFSTISSPSPTYLPAFSPPLTNGEGSGSGGSDHLVYISNPMYDNETCRIDQNPTTPFETPDTSPSRLGMSCSSSSSSSAVVSATSSPSSLPMTPPLAPMKKLPEQACSISLRDARSLCTSGSGSESVNGPSSSSSSGSPRTSPSW